MSTTSSNNSMYSLAYWREQYARKQQKEEEEYALKRRGSWSSDLVLCEGSSSEADFDFAHQQQSPPYPLKSNSNSRRRNHHHPLQQQQQQQYQSSQSPYPLRNSRQYGSNNAFSPAVISDDEEEATIEDECFFEDDDTFQEDDDFDFSHLVEESSEDDDDEDADQFEFEPYYDRETNRTIMRLRMKQIFSLDRQHSILEEAGEDEEGAEVVPLEEWNLKESVQDEWNQNAAAEQYMESYHQDTNTESYMDHEPQEQFHHQQQQHKDEWNQDAAEASYMESQRDYREPYMERQQDIMASEPQPHHQPHHQPSESIEGDATPPLMCPSSVTSGSEEASSHQQQASIHPAAQQQIEASPGLEPWKAIHLIPPPPPPPPVERPNLSSLAYIEEMPPQEEPTYNQEQPLPLVEEPMQQTPHVEKDHESSPTTPARSTTTTTISTPRTLIGGEPQEAMASAPDVDVPSPKNESNNNDTSASSLALYGDMIQGGQDIDAVERLMQRDSNLQPGEIHAFVLGVKSCMSMRQKTTRPAGNTSETSSQQVRRSSSILEDPKTSRKMMMDFLTENTKKTARRRTTRRSHDDGDNHAAAEDVDGPAETKSAISVMSTLSCRELSIQRLRRRFATKRKEDDHDVEKLLKDLSEAQSRQQRLEKQLNQAGICLAEDIPYHEAKEQVQKIAQKMESIGHSQVSLKDKQQERKLRQEYYVLEQQMEKYMRALELTDEYLQEQLTLERDWDDLNREKNQAALKQVWKHLPVNFRHVSISEWPKTRTPSGKYLPKPFVQKFSRTNILTLLRMPPDYIRRSHPSNLESRRVTGLTLPERRALEAYLNPIATKYWQPKTTSSNPLTKRKWNWYCVLRQSLKDAVASHERHSKEYGTHNKSCTCSNTGTSKCPIYSSLDYSLDDYGYPSDVQNPEYEEIKENAKKKDESSPAKKPAATAMPRKANSTLLSEIAAARGKSNIKRKAAKASSSSSSARQQQQHRASMPAVLHQDNGGLRNSFLAELQARSSKGKAT